MTIINLKKAVLLPVLLSVAISAFCQEQKSPILGTRMWSEEPLSWDDFQIRHIPDDSQKTSEVCVFTDTHSEVRKKGNSRFIHVEINAYVDKLLSWYDPDKADQWQLRYNQVIFDLTQIFAKKTQFDLNSTYSPALHNNSDYYNRLLRSKIEALEMETDGGRDSSVIKRYEAEVKKEFEQLSLTEPSIPVESGVSWGMGVFWSYGYHQVLGAQSKNMRPFNGFGMNFDLRIHDMFLDIDMGADRSSGLKVSNFYHDPKYNYDWVEDKAVDYFHANLNIGSQVLSRQYYRIIPYIGLGVAGISQETDIEKETVGKETRYENSAMWGFRLQAGVKTDWKILHFMDDFYYYAPSDLILRFYLFGAYDHFETIGNVWSVNLGISFGLDGYFLKK